METLLEGIGKVLFSYLFGHNVGPDLSTLNKLWEWVVLNMWVIY